MGYIDELGQKAVQAKRKIASASTGEKNAVLIKIAQILRENTDFILEENEKDIADARQNGITETMVDRLRLTKERIEGIADACLQLVNLEDPVGEVLEGSVRPNGMRITKVRVPLGVAGIIYESRPNVTVDAAALCIKSGNAAVLRGGKEAIHSNKVLMGLMQQALRECGFAGETVQLVEDTSREVATEMMRANEYIDVLIPRGGEKLVASVCEAATMPVLKHYKGVCHAYVDAGADIGQALEIIANAKAQRPGVCNALEALLVNAEIAPDFLPRLAKMMAGLGVELRACARSLPLLGPGARAQAPEDLGCEFHDLVLAVCVVENMEEALDHIARYGSRHTEIICTQDYGRAMRFLREADASMVAVNASTRFNDGGQLGLGAEIGISTSKLHAYGPMGLKELTTTKFVVLGNGQIRN